jgi:transcriptional regulator with XRE-family HTH domain
MGAREDPKDVGRRVAGRLRAEVGEDIRTARLGAGISQLVAGEAAGMSHSQVGRIERGALVDLTLDQACRAAAAVGLRVTMRTWPDGDPVRDAAQLALLARFRARLPAGARWQTEVPMPLPGDRRAWDAVIGHAGRRAGCEAETSIRDIQALERRLALKVRDGDVDVLILLVSDTAANRRVLAAHREDLRGLLPLDGREILAGLRAARLPERSGLIVL